MRNSLEELPSQILMPLACSCRASVLPLMNHSSSSATPATVHVAQPRRSTYSSARTSTL